MKVNEYGSEHEKTVAMFQCAAEPGWVFIPSAEALAKDYHVFLFIADGHDELGTTFVSIEKYVDDAASYLKENGIRRLDLLYGVSMGGAAVIRFLATQDIIVDKAIHYRRRDHAISLSEAGMPSDRAEGLGHDHAGHQIILFHEAGRTVGALDAEG